MLKPCAWAYRRDADAASDSARPGPFLGCQGFVEDRQSGSHLTLWHEGRGVSVTIPSHPGCDLSRGLAVRILKDAGFSVDDYLAER